MRRALLFLTMFAGIALVVWAGWKNFSERRRAAQMEGNRVELVPDNSAAPASDSPVTTSPLRGKPAPAFTLVDLAGKKVSLSDFRGHPLVVNFWATYCAPCKFEMPWLEEFSRKYASQGFDVIGVDYDSEVGAATIEKNAQKLGVTYPILLSDPKIEDAYLKGTDYLPMSFYVDKAGTIVEVTAGLGSKDQLESMVKETIGADEK